MPSVTHLTSPDNPRIKAAARLVRQGRQRRKAGLFVAEGMRQVGRAIEVGIGVEEMFWSPDLLAENASQVEAWQRQTGATGFTLPEKLLRKISFLEHPEGVVAVCRTPARDLKSILPGADLLLVAVGIEKPGNLGAIARSADAAGADALVVADAVCDPFAPASLTASTGAVLTLPVVDGDSATLQRAIVDAGVRIIATSPDAENDCYAADLTGRVALVIGPEDRGLDDAWLAAGEAVKIPMAGRVVDSLNASTAAAVLLFEAVRQRRG